MTSRDLVARVKEDLRRAEHGRPPFTLITGSGFSYPLVPTTTQIVREDLPWWLLCNPGEKEGPERADFLDHEVASRWEERRAEFATQFWAGFWNDVKSTKDGAELKLADDGLPERGSIPVAYQLALSSGVQPGLSSPDQVRRYFADVVKRVGKRLNPAHLYLAALAADHPRLFGTVFTTNFDPLLQRAMQFMNVPYFVSDQPDMMQHADDDDVVDALHLVYAHGSVYRYLLLNSSAEIKAHAERNAPLLQEYFRKHAVLIVGYSGWDDAITQALVQVKQFGCNLYWCDRAPEPEASGLSPAAISILKKHENAFYVPIEGADELMLDLYRSITDHALPKLFRDPIGSVQAQLDLCDLSGKTIEGPERDRTTTSNETASASDPGSLDLGDEVARIRTRLDEAEKAFRGDPAGAGSESSVSAARVRDQLAEANERYFSGAYEEAIEKYSVVIEHEQLLHPIEQADVRHRRGYAYGARGGVGDTERAIADYTAVINMPDAPAEQRAKATNNRGIAYGTRGGAGNTDLAIADFTAVIAMPDAPTAQLAIAFYNRGVVYGTRGGDGDTERAIEDYTAVIAMSDAPAEQRARATNNRGYVYGTRGGEGDTERAIEDYTAVINMPDAPAAVVETARTILRNLRGTD